MPLRPGKGNIGFNIRELELHGSKPRPHKQIVAIALSEARRTAGAKGGLDQPQKFSKFPSAKRYKLKGEK